MIQRESIYGGRVGLNLGQSPTWQSSEQRCGLSEQTTLTVKRVAVCKIAKAQKASNVSRMFVCFRWRFKKKRFLKCVSLFTTNKTPPAALSPYMDHSTAPTPPLSALCLRWIAYLHGHVTPRGKGAQLCASLTLVQLPPSQCHYFHSATQACLKPACHVHQSEELVDSVQVSTYAPCVLLTGQD